LRLRWLLWLRLRATNPLSATQPTLGIAVVPPIPDFPSIGQHREIVPANIDPGRSIGSSGSGDDSRSTLKNHQTIASRLTRDFC
jgi:hypothetical protein